MRVVKVCMVVCAVVTVAGCGGDKPRKVDPRDGGLLVVREVHRERADHLSYIEGKRARSAGRSYRVRREMGGRLIGFPP